MMRCSSICWYIFGYQHAVELFDFFLNFFEVLFENFGTLYSEVSYFFPYFYEHL